MNTGESQCSICSSIPQSEASSNGPAHPGDSVVETALQVSHRDPGSPEAIFVHSEVNGLRRCRAVENIRAHMSICETYKDLVIDKVSSAVTDFSLEVNSDPIVADSDVDTLAFDGNCKRKRENAQEMFADGGDSVVTEADQVMTQNLHDGESMEMRDPSSSTITAETASNTRHNGHDESDEEMLVEKPRPVRWFRFSVIDTGIG